MNKHLGVGLAVILWTTILPVAMATTAETAAIMVEEVVVGQGAEQTGIRAGDRLLRWERPAGNPAVSGTFLTTFNVETIEQEQGPRSPLRLQLQRGDEIQVVELAPDSAWGVRARPDLSEGELAVFRRWWTEPPGDPAATDVAAFRRRLAAGAAWQEAWFLAALADRLAALEQWAAAEAWCRAALAAGTAAGDAEAMIRCQIRLADLLQKTDQPAAAAAAGTEALELQQRIAPESLVAADLHQSLGLLAWSRDDFDAADHHFRRSLQWRQQLAPGRMITCSALNNVANVAFMRGDFETADRHYSQALALVEQLTPQARLHGNLLSNLGLIARRRGDLAEAERLFERALAVRRAEDAESLAVAGTLYNLGIISIMRGQFKKAEEQLGLALALQERLAPDSRRLAYTLNSLGNLANDQGDLAAAERYFRRSLAIKEKTAPGSVEVAVSLHNLGNVLMNRGDLVAAESVFRREFDLQRSVAPDHIDMTFAVESLGDIAYRRGDLDLSESYHHQALQLRTRIAPTGLDTARSWGNLGTIWRARGALEQAADAFARMLELTRTEAPDSLPVADCLQSLAQVRADQQRSDEAETLFLQALHIYETLGGRNMKYALCLNNLGELRLNADRLDEAETVFRQALAIRQQLAPDSRWEAESLYCLGRVHRIREELPAALDCFRQAVAALSAQKSRLGGGRESQERFSARYADYYRSLIELEIRLGQEAAAFVTLEQYRAQVLRQMLAERDLLFTADVPAQLRQDRQRLDTRADRCRQQLAELDMTGENTPRIEALQRELQQIHREQQEVQERIRACAPALAALESPKPLDLPAATALLEKDTLLLSYSVSSDQSLLFTLLNGRLKVHVLPVRRTALAAAVNMYRRLLSRPAGDDPWRQEKGAELFRMLLQPARAELAAARHVLVCPDGPLHILPFAALPVSAERYLIQEKSVSRITSVTVLAEIRQHRRPGRTVHQVVAFGDPHYPGPAAISDRQAALIRSLPLAGLDALPATRREVEAICRLFPGAARPYLGSDAREEAVRQIPPATSIVHFACHGFFDEFRPLESGLVFTLPSPAEAEAENGILQAWEILDHLRLDTDLVTLSACETGLGEERGGEGLVGLARAFHFAGARSVLSSLWKVADESTALLMTSFYGYLQQGKTRSEALCLAQRELLAGTAGPAADAVHPFHWAGLVLTGEYR
ncbi:MAG: CHAT domain-containing protein [Acidobacteria bacterium]|nr:CHAT domain-containing protein [Acidobacteriota bacterium]